MQAKEYWRLASYAVHSVGSLLVIGSSLMSLLLSNDVRLKPRSIQWPFVYRATPTRPCEPLH